MKMRCAETKKRVQLIEKTYSVSARQKVCSRQYSVRAEIKKKCAADNTSPNTYMSPVDSTPGMSAGVEVHGG